jgi:hypothetical protein
MEEDLNDFSFDEKQTKQLMRKAKLWSTIKMVGIVVIATPIIMAGLWYGIIRWSSNQGSQSMQELVWMNEISAPNIHISNQTSGESLFGGVLNTQTYKLIGNKPYIWEPVERTYNLFGNTSRRYGSFGSIQIDQAGSNQFHKYNSYTGDREMFFYHPEISYDSYNNSLSYLKQVEETSVVELGLSFDQAYSYDEIKSLIPLDVQFVWWWVDTYTNDYLDYLKQTGQSIYADSLIIYGFHAEQFTPYGGIDSFITSVEHLRKSSKSFKWYADEVYKSLAGPNNTLEESDVKIIGAVVTGTAEQLKVLQGLPFIKASTFGVISDKKDIPN